MVKHLIIGCGPAALSAVEKIRSINREDEIRLVSNEGCLPYSPAALPYLVSGRLKERDIYVRDREYFKTLNVDFESGKEVVQVFPEQKSLLYRDGEEDDYDTLLIATGAGPAPLPGDEPARENILKFRTLNDYFSLRRLLTKGKEVAILGAGMVAMELALALVERGNKVQVIGRGRPLRSYFDEKPGAYIREIFLEKGVRIETGREIKGVETRNQKIKIHCSGCDYFESDLLVACLGVEARKSFLSGSGIQMGEGILVDSRMMTNLDGVYAAGDVVETPDYFHRTPGMSAVIPSALAQGSVAGSNMAKTEAGYEGWIAMNIFNMFGNLGCSIGMSANDDEGTECIEEEEDKKRYFKRLVLKDDRLVGAMFLNADVMPGAIRYLIEKGIRVGGSKDELFMRTKETSCRLMLEAERKRT